MLKIGSREFEVVAKVFPQTFQFDHKLSNPGNISSTYTFYLLSSSYKNSKRITVLVKITKCIQDCINSIK